MWQLLRNVPRPGNSAANNGMKLPARPVASLAVGSAGGGTSPGSARAAPGLPAAYPKRYAVEVADDQEPSG
jgi:hypothetical protein